MIDLQNTLIEFLRILADPTRLDILGILRKEEKTARELEEMLDKAQSTISKHLNYLIETNLIMSIKKDNINYFSIKIPEVFSLISNLQKFVVKLFPEKFADLSKIIGVLE